MDFRWADIHAAGHGGGAETAAETATTAAAETMASAGTVSGGSTVHAGHSTHSTHSVHTGILSSNSNSNSGNNKGGRPATPSAHTPLNGAASDEDKAGLSGFSAHGHGHGHEQHTRTQAHAAPGSAGQHSSTTTTATAAAAAANADGNGHASGISTPAYLGVAAAATSETPIPTSGNNDYMLFLNLTTPTSTSAVDESQKQHLTDSNLLHNHNSETNSQHGIPQQQQQHQQQQQPDFSNFHFENMMDAEHLEFIMQPPQPPQNLASSSSLHSAKSRVNSVEFTPLLSPMMNPTLERVNSNKGKTGFSPLSSPVLEFQKYNNASSLRKKRKDPNDSNSNMNTLRHITSNTNNSTNGNIDLQDDMRDADLQSSKRSKTPVTTPLLSTMDSQRSSISSVKNQHNKGSSASPNQYNHNNNNNNQNQNQTPFQTFVFKNQQFTGPNSAASSSKESSISNKSQQQSNKSITNTMNTDFTNTSSFLDAFEGELTLPPPPPPNNNHNHIGDDENYNIDNFADQNYNNHFIMPISLTMGPQIGSKPNNLSISSVTPSTLMSQNSTPHLSHKKSSVLLNPNHHKSAQSSPVILPSSSVPIDSMRFDFKPLNQQDSTLHQTVFAQYNQSINTNTNSSNPQSLASTPGANGFKHPTPTHISSNNKHMPAVGTSILSGGGLDLEQSFKHSNKSTPRHTRPNSTNNPTITTSKQTDEVPNNTNKGSFSLHSFNVMNMMNMDMNMNGSGNNNNTDPYNNSNQNGNAPQTDKKMSHKLAEQGRRNRMNVAIQELEKLIPDSMKQNITVPSKATTVELGCIYISQLLDRIETLSASVQNGNDVEHKHE